MGDSPIIHYDLFAGIGGFSIALDEVFYDREIKHIFCEWEQFPAAVLKQHWPDGEYWGDIADLVAHTNSERLQRKDIGGTTGSSRAGEHFTIVTGGFPCQPFSQAGRRKGTADDRYQWPNMFEVIRNVKPDWVIAENVRGLVTWNNGMVLEQVCSDLESKGYEVQPLIIPAVAVNAPHRRDRVWIIAHCSGERQQPRVGLERQQNAQATEQRSQNSTTVHAQHPRQHGAKNTKSPASRGNGDTPRSYQPEQLTRSNSLRPEDANARSHPDWNRSWQEVAFATCNDPVDDGLSKLVDGVSYSRAKWRNESLKAYGNAIVPQVALRIFETINEYERCRK